MGAEGERMRPPKVAMVVANFITGDSRVQKVARWVAAAGWDVTLVGRSRGDRVERFALGRAKVIRVPVGSIRGSKPAGSDWRQRALLDDFKRFELVLDELRPDLIHAHDINTLGIAIRAKLLAAQRGQTVKVIYDAHEYVAGLTYIRPSWRLAMLADESEYIPLADGVVTVTPELAKTLQLRYDLDELPVVVRNTPELQPQGVDIGAELSDIRTACRLSASTELIVYSGWVIHERGLATVAAALPQLPTAHFAVQVSDRRRCAALEREAKSLEVRERLHILPYVDSHQVVEYLRTASAGVIPSLHTADESAVFPAKYYEYMHARLPIIASDAGPQAAMTRELGNGEVFAAGDPDSFASAARSVLSDRDRYVSAYATPGLLEANAWEAEMPALLELYSQLAGSAAPTETREHDAGDPDTASSGVDLPASAAYWEERYRLGGTSGAGSYSPYAELTAEIINRVLRERQIEEVIEYGCGDGNQLSYLRVAKYIGLDVAPSAIERCRERFRADQTKRFLLYNPSDHVNRNGGLSAQCALSKDVIFHLVEDDVFEIHMRHLFASARRLVVIVASDLDWHIGPHEKHRRFTTWVEANVPEWRLVEQVDSPAPYDFVNGEGMLSNVYVFEHNDAQSREAIAAGASR